MAKGEDVAPDQAAGQEGRLFLGDGGVEGGPQARGQDLCEGAVVCVEEGDGAVVSGLRGVALLVEHLDDAVGETGGHASCGADGRVDVRQERGQLQVERSVQLRR